MPAGNQAAAAVNATTKQASTSIGAIATSIGKTVTPNAGSRRLKTKGVKKVPKGIARTRAAQPMNDNFKTLTKRIWSGVMPRALRIENEARSSWTLIYADSTTNTSDISKNRPETTDNANDMLSVIDDSSEIVMRFARAASPN